MPGPFPCIDGLDRDRAWKHEREHASEEAHNSRPEGHSARHDAPSDAFVRLLATRQGDDERDGRDDERDDEEPERYSVKFDQKRERWGDRLGVDHLVFLSSSRRHVCVN